MFPKQKITPFLWFDNEAEEAAQYYISIFPDSRIVSTSHYGDMPPGRKGQVMTVEFQLEGQDFIALNGGPGFPFTQAVSMFVICETQAEIDTLWSKLLDGGEAQQCGWLKDRYGLSWQIVPRGLLEMIRDADPERAKRSMEAMLQMVKFDMGELRKAYEGR